MWYVEFRAEITQTVVMRSIPCSTEKKAESIARAFNRSSQDSTWNAVRAHVECR